MLILLAVIGGRNDEDGHKSDSSRAEHTLAHTERRTEQLRARLGA
jgi:hypothetical protein